MEEAVKTLKAGGVIAFPTDTVFGIGACLDKPEAIARIFEIKGRPKDKPLQILVKDLEQAKTLGTFDHDAKEFAKKHWPGAFTLIVPKKETVPALVTGGKNTVGLRVPDHPVILELIEQCGPIVATSANEAGKSPALTMSDVEKLVKGVDYILPGKVTTGKASQVIDLTTNKILRQ